MSKPTVYDVITDQILEHLRKGVVPWHRPWDGAPKNLVSGKEYRGINTILLGPCGYGSPFWVTYKQAQTLGGNPAATTTSGMVDQMFAVWEKVDVEKLIERLKKCVHEVGP